MVLYDVKQFERFCTISRPLINKKKKHVTPLYSWSDVPASIEDQDTLWIISIHAGTLKQKGDKSNTKKYKF